MTKKRSSLASEKGFTLIYLAVSLTTMLLFTGLATDSGRAYVVKAQLSKAVDGAALGAARMLNTGNPRQEAGNIFQANVPLGYMGTTSVTNPADSSFYTMVTDEANGVNIITIRATAVMPTTFMSLGTRDEVTVSSMGEATRRMVDLSLILDTSSSIGSAWSAVRDASRTFVNAFDPVHDRMALVTYSNGAQVREPMSASRGFIKANVLADIPNGLPGGSTNMVEGLYRGWDELRSVPGGSQSGLRVIVLFTDGASNGVPGMHDASGVSKSLRTADFPKNLPDPDNQTHNSPSINGLYQTENGNQGPNYSLTPPNWNSPQTHPNVQYLPARTFHSFHRSAGIPNQFDLQTNLLTVRGAAQSARRGLRNFNAGLNRYPAEVFNINNAARNVLEIIADQARSDNGDYRIRIYTIGMGALVRYNLGTMPEQPEEILMRVANDVDSPDYNDDQLEGKYYYAETAADVGPAFQALQNEIIRLTK
jgi:hypothetical protein